MRKLGLTTVTLLLAFMMLSCSNKEADPIITDNYVSIPDANFEKILIELGLDSDGIINQQILKEDALSIDKLEINYSNFPYPITNLSGIEEFTNLTYLSANQHEIEEIDISKNVKLDTLSLAGNYLTAIDLSNNNSLQYLSLISNELSSIEGLSNAQSLKNINLSYNNLKSFILNNSAVESFSITDTLLEELDVNGAINLKSLLVTLNQLRSLDVSQNTSLEVLVVSANKLESINLENNDQLKYFYASSNSFTQLDVSEILQLVDLRVDRNPELSCIRIETGQEIPSVSLDEHQELSEICQ